jgi:hypothetical protein
MVMKHFLRTSSSYETRAVISNIILLSMIDRIDRVLCLNLSIALLFFFMIQEKSIGQSVQELPIRATINATNPDATVVGGQYPSPNGHAYIWIDGALNQLPLPENASISAVEAVANDTSIAAGWFSFQGSSRAIKWVDGEYHILPSPPDNISIATAISDDGSIVLGSSSSLEMWINSERFTLPLLGGNVIGGAYALSGDGSRIVGYQSTAGNVLTRTNRPVIWKNQQPSYLELPAGYDQGIAFSISRNGEYVAGYAFTENSELPENYTYYVWHNGNVIDIGLPANHFNPRTFNNNAIGISNDGKVVVGRYQKLRETDEGSNTWGASFIWTEQGGMKDFVHYLSDDLNFDTERPLFTVRDLTPDGRIAVATASHFSSTTGPIRPLIIYLQDPDRELIVNSVADRALSTNATHCATGQFVTIDGEMKPECTLRAAIQLANRFASRDSVSFNIPGDSPFTIQLASALPAIDQPLVVDATTQEGYNGIPLINLRGNVTNAFIIRGGDTTLRGFSIGGFNGTAIRIEVKGGNIIQANHIGTDAAGNSAIANGRGVNILHSPDNIIGGNLEGEGNVISGNIVEGVYLFGAASKNNVVSGNRIGTNRDGTAALRNRVGVRLENSPDNIIGGTTDIVGQGPGNLISGNTDTRPNIKMSDVRTGIGVLIDGNSAKGNRIQGNLIGTDHTGQQAIGNGFVGVFIYNAPKNLIGGDEASHGNLISANSDQNVQIFGEQAVENIVAGNVIGPNVDGTVSLTEKARGVGILFASRNRIGGVTSTPGTAPGNLISGNAEGGVVLAGINPEALPPEVEDVEVGIASENVIAGNLIGTNKAGTSALANRTGVVAIYDAYKTQIGGDQAGYRNVISGNEVGVILADTAGGLGPHESIIAGNYIGTTINGNEPLGNGGPGIMLSTLSFFITESTGITGVRIGGTTNASRNIIAGNKEKQIDILGPMSAGTVIMNNYIGVLANGQAGQDPEDSEFGILINSNEVLIGADHNENVAPNVVGGNEYGIVLVGGGNIVSQNKIGTNPGGTTAVANRTGVWVLGDRNILAENTISGNTNYGVMIGQAPESPAFQETFFDPEMTTIIKNNIGTNAQVRNALGNGLGVEGAGVMFWRGKSLHMYMNVLSGNHHGVHINNSSFESGTRMAANFIGVGGMIPNEIEDVIALPEFVPIPNRGDGVHVTNGRVYLTNKPEIELLEEIELGNFIQNNIGAGVRRTGSNMSAALEIKSNLFFGNTGLGIDIGPVGPGAGSDFHDPPVLMQPVFVDELARLRGVSGTSGGLQLYTTPICHPSGYGEGRLHLSDHDRQVSAGEEFSADISLPGNLRVGFYITALLTNGSRTSEFSQCMRIASEEKYQEQLLDELAENALTLLRLTLELEDSRPEKAQKMAGIFEDVRALIYAVEFDLPADHNNFEGSARATDGSEITPNTIDTTMYWTLGAVNVPDPLYNLCLNVDGMVYMQEYERHVLVHRNGIGSPWKPMDTSTNPNGSLCADGLSAFGDIAIAAHDDSIPTFVDPDEHLHFIPESFTLLQNYPNPFNPSTVIGYALPESGDVLLEVYDMLGRRIAALVNEYKEAGRYTITFNAGTLSSGVYIYRITTGEHIAVRRMMMMK